MVELNVDVVLAHESEKEILDLKKQQKEIAKRIKFLSSSKKMDNYLERWVAVDKFKKDTVKQFNASPLGEKMSFNHMMKIPDYYIYVMKKPTKGGGTITLKASSKDVEWVKNQIKSHNNESKLIENANAYRKEEWLKKNKPKRKKSGTTDLTKSGITSASSAGSKNQSLPAGTSGTGID